MAKKKRAPGNLIRTTATLGDSGEERPYDLELVENRGVGDIIGLWCTRVGGSEGVKQHDRRFERLRITLTNKQALELAKAVIDAEHRRLRGMRESKARSAKLRSNKATG